jgi:DMSO/TMAO reductase YedYZ molybdopterin-dependent catalytic subunit
MHRPIRILRRALALTALAAITLQAQTHASSASDTLLRIDGDIPKPLAFTRAALEALTQDTLRASAHDAPARLYRGVPISALLALVGAPSGHALRGPALATTIIASARDGYRVAFSIAELDSGFVQRRVLVALTADGKPMNDEEGPLRIIVEGEGRPARWIRQLIALHIRRAPDDPKAR